MKLIYPATQFQADELQKVLDENPEPGIVDIRASVNPVYIVAMDADSVIGVAALNWGSDLCELYKLYVSPLSKRKGIGRALVEKVIEILRDNNVACLGIQITERSAPFWERMAETYSFKHFYGEKYFLDIT